ncbi:hypothetical protein GCM10009869_11350 [Amnibacterium kyonggiense]
MPAPLPRPDEERLAVLEEIPEDPDAVGRSTRRAEEAPVRGPGNSWVRVPSAPDRGTRALDFRMVPRIARHRALLPERSRIRIAPGGGRVLGDGGTRRVPPSFERPAPGPERNLHP